MKTRKVLSLLLAVTMLLTAFSVAGLSVSAAEITAPGAGYVKTETVVVEDILNRKTGANIGTWGAHALAGTDSNGYATGLTYTIKDVATMYKSSRLADSISTQGGAKSLDMGDLSTLYVSFDLTVGSGFVDSEMRMEFRGKNANGTETDGKEGRPYDIGFTVDLVEGTQHVCVPFSEMKHFSNLCDASDWVEGGYTAGITYVHMIFGKNHYSSSCLDDSSFTISNLRFVNISWAPEKEEAVKVLNEASTVTVPSASKSSLTLTDTTYTIDGQSCKGLFGTITNADTFNASNIEYDHVFSIPADVTDYWDKAYLRLFVRLNGTIATNAATDMMLQLKVADSVGGSVPSRRYDIDESTVNADGWYCYTLPLTTLDSGNKLARESLTKITIGIINAGTTLQSLTAANGDTFEFAGFDICTLTEQPTTPAGIDLKFSEVSLSLSDNLTMNFKANKALFDSKYADPYAMINGNKIAGVLDEKNGVYVFSYDNIAPQSMADTITATLFATYNGSLCEGKTVESSVKTYCEWLLANATSDAQRRLVVDLYNYGSAAQTYVNKRPNRLIKSYLSDTQAAWGTTEMATVANKTVNEGNGSAVTWSHAGLVLDDSVRVWFEFAAADTTGLTVKITDTTGKELDVIEAAAFAEQSAGVYRVSFDGLNAKGMRRLLNVTVYDAQGNAVSNTLTYSVESYVYTVLNGGSDNAKLQALVTALMNYGDAAIAYAAA